jgi:hypothetical protein
VVFCKYRRSSIWIEMMIKGPWAAEPQTPVAPFHTRGVFDLDQTAVATKAKQKKDQESSEISNRTINRHIPKNRSVRDMIRLRVCLFGLLLLKSSCSWWAVRKQLWEAAAESWDLMFGRSAVYGSCCWFDVWNVWNTPEGWRSCRNAKLNQIS